MIWDEHIIGARGLPARLILSLGAMGWGSGRIQKFFRRRLLKTEAAVLLYKIEAAYLVGKPPAG